MKQDYLKNNSKEQAKKEQEYTNKSKEEKATGYGNKKTEGPNRPQD